ncbi:MAG: DUF4424 family protein [Alphaproteobacteria bacterium]|nr:DUF4424 family protein [Alphaproteobacteria bacterium]
MFKKGLLLATALAALAGRAGANDGFTGVTATGLQFQKTDAIAMESEDLFIGLDAIKVDYVFKNTTGADVTGVVAFPMPAIYLASLIYSPTRFSAADLDTDNPLGFTATVDGKAVPVATDRRAYIVPPEEPSSDPNAPYVPPPASAEYDEPGTDVTDYLTSLGIPIVFDTQQVFAALDKLPESTLKELEAKNLVFKGSPENGPDMRWEVGWAIMIRHSWTQTFPAGAELRISHSYKALPSGGLFYWYDWTKPTADWETDPNEDDKAKYCIDEGTGKAIDAALPADPDAGGAHRGTAFNIAYVLTTANTWKGPIGSFKLTLDKGKPENVLSLCMDGIAKTGPTTFEVTKTDFVPQKDLEVLVVSASPAFPE